MYLRNFVSSRPASPSSHASKTEAGQTAREVLKTTLKLAEKALDGVPIPGAKAAIGSLLEVIGGLEVRLLYSLTSVPEYHSISQKTAKNRDDIRELEAELQNLTSAVLKPLEGKTEADIPPELRERVANFVT